ENNASAIDQLRRLLNTFEAQFHTRVKIRVLSWNQAWPEMMNYALYGGGPAVSEIGSTWVGSLVGMNRLRSFKTQEVSDPAKFLSAAWQTTSLYGDPTVWAMPWLTDTRILYYRRDLLEKAGVDPQSAFESAEAMEHSLSRLPMDTDVTPWA